MLMKYAIIKVICKATDNLVACVECDEIDIPAVMRDLRNNHPGCRVFQFFND